MCNQNYNNNSGPRKRHTFGQFNIECCTGDYCNNGSFPELPPKYSKYCLLNDFNRIYSFLCFFICTDEVSRMDTSSSYLLKLSFAIVAPVLIISALAICVIYLMRRTHHKRLLSTRSKQDPETYYASDDLRATSAGDSTMKV